MRQKMREIKERTIISAMLDRMDTMHVAMHDDPFPYVVPLNFGYEWQDNELVFFFHCAREGLKLDLLRQNPHVCVNVSAFISYASSSWRGHLHDYRSVTAYGLATEIDRTDRTAFLHAHECLLSHNHRKMMSGDEAAMQYITLWEIRCSAEQVFGKAEIVPHSVEEVPFYTGLGDGTPVSDAHIQGMHKDTVQE